MKFSTVLFLSDLNKIQKKAITNDILSLDNDNELKQAIKCGKDIRIGEYYKLSEYESI